MKPKFLYRFYFEKEPILNGMWQKAYSVYDLQASAGAFKQAYLCGNKNKRARVEVTEDDDNVVGQRTFFINL